MGCGANLLVDGFENLGLENLGLLIVWYILGELGVQYIEATINAICHVLYDEFLDDWVEFWWWTSLESLVKVLSIFMF